MDDYKKIEELRRAVMNLVRNQVAGIQVMASIASNRLLTEIEVEKICNEIKAYPLRIDELFLKELIELEKKKSS